MSGLKVERAFAVAILVVLLFASVPRVFASGSKTFPPKNETMAYVNRLLTDYDSIIAYHFQGNATALEDMRQFFPLYSMTFEVIVTLAGPNDNTSIDLIFIPEGGNTTEVVYDYANYLYDMMSPAGELNTCTASNQGTTSASGMTTVKGTQSAYAGSFGVTMGLCAFDQVQINMTGDGGSEQNVYFNYNGTLMNAPIAIGVLATDITGNQTTPAISEAQSLYDAESSYGSSWLAAHATTTHKAIDCGNPLNWPSCAVNWLEGNPIVLLIIIIFGGIEMPLELTGKGVVHLMEHRHKKKPEDSHEEKPKNKTNPLQ